MRYAAAAVMALLLALAAQPAKAEVILLQRPDGEHGVGWLFRDQGGACRIATPRHVVEDTTGAMTTPDATDRYGRQLATADAAAPEDLELDIAFLHVPGVLAEEGCTLSRLSRVPLDHVLSAWTTGTLTIATRLDGVQTIRVERLVSTRDEAGGGTIVVAPTSPTDILQKGMSGGVIMDGDRPIAMLTNVDSSMGIGVALRFDVIAHEFAAVEARHTAAAQGPDEAGMIQDVAVLSGDIAAGGSIGDFLSGAAALVLSPEHGGAVLLATSAETVVASGVSVRAGNQDLSLTKLIVEAAIGSNPFALVRVCDGGEAAMELLCVFAPRRLDRVKLSLVPAEGSVISIGGIALVVSPGG